MRDRQRALDDVAVAVEADVAEQPVLDPRAQELAGDRRTRPVGALDRVEQDLGRLGGMDEVARGQAIADRPEQAPRLAREGLGRKPTVREPARKPRRSSTRRIARVIAVGVMPFTTTSTPSWADPRS
jgi:hypothetical protein